eukprot:1552419-Rhodomonas_salina.1
MAEEMSATEGKLQKGLEEVQAKAKGELLALKEELEQVKGSGAPADPSAPAKKKPVAIETVDRLGAAPPASKDSAGTARELTSEDAVARNAELEAELAALKE